MVNGEEASLGEENAWKPWYPLVALVFALIAETVIGLVVLLVDYGGHFTQAQANNPTPAVTDISSGLGEISFVVIAITVALWAGAVWPAQFGLRAPRISWARILGLVLGVYLALLLFEALWQVVVSSHASEHYLVKDVGATSGAGGVLAACLVLCVVAPCCEEFLFRGFIFGALRSWRGPLVGAVVTGVLFGAIHAGSAPAVDLVPLAVFGFLLCLLRQYTGSIYPGIVLHSLNNAVTLVVTAGWSFGAFVGVLLGSLALIAALIAAGQRTLRLRLV